MTAEQTFRRRRFSCPDAECLPAYWMYIYMAAATIDIHNVYNQPNQTITQLPKISFANLNFAFTFTFTFYNNVQNEDSSNAQRRLHLRHSSSQHRREESDIPHHGLHATKKVQHNTYPILEAVLPSTSRCTQHQNHRSSMATPNVSKEQPQHTGRPRTDRTWLDTPRSKWRPS